MSASPPFNEEKDGSLSREKGVSERSEGLREVSGAVDRSTDAVNGNHNGKKEQLIASHADVLVADGLKLPYKVSLICTIASPD